MYIFRHLSTTYPVNWEHDRDFTSKGRKRSKSWYRFNWHYWMRCHFDGLVFWSLKLVFVLIIIGFFGPLAEEGRLFFSTPKHQIVVTPINASILPSYHFQLTQRPYGRMNYSQYRHWSQSAFEEMVINAFPRSIRSRVSKYLPYTLYFAEKHRLDPLWVLAVMWTESRFDPLAISPVGATGLMQVMLKTGREIVQNKVPGRKITKNYGQKLVERPYTNIQLGVEYLGHLLKRFGSYRYATVAYNMGPSWVSNRLALKRPVGKKNLYLEKVETAYRMIMNGMSMQMQFARWDYLGTTLVDRPNVAISPLPSGLAQLFESPKRQVLALGGDFFGKTLEHL